MVRRPGDDRKFPGGRAAERLKQFDLARGFRRPDSEEREPPCPEPPPAPREEDSDEK